MPRKKKAVAKSTIKDELITVAINYKNGVYGIGLEAKQNIKRMGYNLKLIERIANQLQYSENTTIGMFLVILNLTIAKNTRYVIIMAGGKPVIIYMKGGEHVSSFEFY